jgi:GNAT superfamily N-acetyltransferase
VWVAEREARIVGFVAAGPSRTEDGLGELYAIYVLPEAWGSGAAAALMSAFRDWLAGEGYMAAMLWVLADNPRARRFYEREGWRVDGERVDTIRGVEVEEALYRLALVGG